MQEGGWVKKRRERKKVDRSRRRGRKSGQDIDANARGRGGEEGGGRRQGNSVMWASTISLARLEVFLSSSASHATRAVVIQLGVRLRNCRCVLGRLNFRRISATAAVETRRLICRVSYSRPDIASLLQATKWLRASLNETPVAGRILFVESRIPEHFCTLSV